MSECSAPVRISANTLDQNGEYGQRIITADCGNRLVDKCKHCADIYRGDSFALLRDGFTDLRPDETAYFVTLTAPGSSEFGQTHGIRRGQNCPCGKRHRREEEILGTPVDPKTYRYDLAAAFNEASSRLFTLGIQRLRRLVGEYGSVRYVRVMEYQRRGLTHAHAVIITTADEGMIRRAYQGGHAIRGLWRKHGPVSHNGFIWGTKMDVQKIQGKTGPSSVSAYIAKLIGYVSKSVDSGLHGVHRDHASMLQTAALRRCKCDHLSSTCLRGAYRHGPNGQRRSGPYRSGGTNEHLCRRHTSAYRMAGFTGHIFGRARNWGRKTRAYLKDVRREHARTSIALDIAETRGDDAAERYLDECDSPSVVIVGSGCSSQGGKFVGTESLVDDQFWSLVNRISADIVAEEQDRAGRALTDAFVAYAELHLPPPVMCCLECGQPSEPEICAECEREAFAGAHPSLDRRSPDQIVWSIAQQRLHLDHTPVPIESAWWAEAELYSAEPVRTEIELPTLF